MWELWCGPLSASVGWKNRWCCSLGATLCGVWWFLLHPQGIWLDHGLESNLSVCLPPLLCSHFSLSIGNLSLYLPISLLSLIIIHSQAPSVCFPLPSRSLRSTLFDIHRCLCSPLAAYFLHSEPDFLSSHDSFAGKSGRQNMSPIVTESFFKSLRKGSRERGGGEGGGGGGGVGESWQKKRVGDEELTKKGSNCDYTEIRADNCHVGTYSMCVWVQHILYKIAVFCMRCQTSTVILLTLTTVIYNYLQPAP